MAKYLLAYTGGGMSAPPEERQKAMDAWMAWFGSLGADIVDQGSPFGPSTTVSGDGSTSEGGASRLTGYTLITAPDLSAATEKAKACPVLTSGGSIEVYEALEMG
jgi:hypothetical protein